MTRATKAKNFSVTLLILYFLKEAVNSYYQKNTLHNYPSPMKTLLSLHCTHHTFAMLLSIWHLKQDVAISPESLSTCLTKTGKNLSSSYWFYLLLISTSESTITPFQVASNLLCNAPVRICVVFVRPHRYLFIILESGNMFLNSLTA